MSVPYEKDDLLEVAHDGDNSTQTDSQVETDPSLSQLRSVPSQVCSIRLLIANDLTDRLIFGCCPASSGFDIFSLPVWTSSGLFFSFRKNGLRTWALFSRFAHFTDRAGEWGERREHSNYKRGWRLDILSTGAHYHGEKVKTNAFKSECLKFCGIQWTREILYCSSSTSTTRFQAGPSPPPVRILRPGRFVQRLLDMISSVPTDRLIQVMNEVLNIFRCYL